MTEQAVPGLEALVQLRQRNQDHAKTRIRFVDVHNVQVKVAGVPHVHHTLVLA